MANIFAELQMISQQNADSSIKRLREDLNAIVEVFKSRDTYLQEVTTFAQHIRHLDVQTLLDCDSFMVQPDVLINEIPRELQHDSLGFCRGVNLVFSGRYVYPVKDVKGDVMGFCGYDKFSDVKYLDSQNYGYKAKRYSCWGMEKLPEYYVSKEPVFFVEGIVCALYLRQCGLQSLALLGSNVSAYMLEIIKRFGSRAIVVVDADEAGNKCRQNLKFRIPAVRVIQSRVAKDIDDSRMVDPNFVEELKKYRNPFYSSKLLK